MSTNNKNYINLIVLPIEGHPFRISYKEKPTDSELIKNVRDVCDGDIEGFRTKMMVHPMLTKNKQWDFVQKLLLWRVKDDNEYKKTNGWSSCYVNENGMNTCMPNMNIIKKKNPYFPNSCPHPFGFVCMVYNDKILDKIDPDWRNILMNFDTKDKFFDWIEEQWELEE